MSPSEQAACILNHYFEQLARRSGLRWSDRNRADIEQAARLLTEDADDEADTIPPYRPPEQERVTVSFERNPADDDPRFAAWQQQRRNQDEQTRRMLARERGHV